MPSYDDLALLVALAERGSLAAAAQYTGIPVATFSRRLHQLEQQLKIQLVQRGSRQLQLTDAGQQWYQHCAPLLQELASRSHQLQSTAQTPAGVIRVVAPINLVRSGFKPLWPQFMACYPQIELRFRLSNRRINLHEQAFDLALRVGALDDSQFIARRVLDLELSLCAAPAYLAQATPINTPADLAVHPRLVANPLDVWQLTRDGISSSISTPARLEADEIDLVVDAALAGLGVTLVPCIYVRDHLAHGALVQLLPAWQMGVRTVYLLWHRRDFLPVRVRLLRDFIVQHGPALVAPAVSVSGGLNGVGVG